MQIAVKVILCINTLPDPMFGYPIDLDKMSTHVVMGYEPKIEALSTRGPIDRLGMPYLAIGDVKHWLYHHVHMGLV